MTTNLAVSGRPFLTLLRYNRRYWRAYAAGAFLAALNAAVGLATPLILRVAVDDFTQQRMTHTVLAVYFVAMVVLAAGTGVSRYAQRMLMIRASRRFEFDLRNDYFQRIQRLSREFFNRTPTGEIMARATNDLNYARDFIGPGIMGTVDMLRVPVTLAVMLYLSVKLTLVALTPLPVVSLFVYLFVMYMHRQSKKVQDQFGVLTSRAQENLAGARVVQAYGIADREIRDFRGAAEVYMKESLKLSLAMSFAWPFIGLLVGAITLIIVWWGGNMVIDGALVSRLAWSPTGLATNTTTFTLGDLSGFLWCLFMLAWPLVEFGWVVTLYQRGAVGMNRVVEFLCETPAVRDADTAATHAATLHGSIQFDAVSFGYDERVAVDDLSFTIEEGKTLAIVGPTGSGKSSIVSLLTREYDPTAGRVLIDGVDIRTIPLHTLRHSIGCVPQDTLLFSDTIRANIAFGNPEAGDFQIQHAAQVAQLHESIADFPNGYDTLLGERGVNLSGGQKQRLAIARALVRDPRILILDDALSSVDTHTEERILKGLQTVIAGRTAVIISHRISAVRNADLILVLDQGRIVERGRHMELLAQCGRYAEMYERQLLEDELEETA